MSGNLRVGIDLVQISRIAASREQFGERFLRRVFTDDEVAYALSSPPHTDARLAARFAAKEAVIKVLRVDGEGINFRDIEVVREPSGACSLALHGEVAKLAAGIGEFALSMSHEGDYATAVVVAL
jgi:holo-[acyl-carrier protein] synthase